MLRARGPGRTLLGSEGPDGLVSTGGLLREYQHLSLEPHGIGRHTVALAPVEISSSADAASSND